MLRRTRLLAALGASALCLSALAACSAEPGSAPAADESTAAEPQVVGYSFPPGVVPGRTKDQPFYTRMDGVLVLPSTPGPHPVVMLVHGSYPHCIVAGKDVVITDAGNTVPWPEGCGKEKNVGENGLTEGPDYFRASASFGYLARELATRGFAVVVPDVNAKEEYWTGEPDATLIQDGLVAAHLDLLKDLNAGHSHGLPWGDRAEGAFDLADVSLVGHSSGGGYAQVAAHEGTVPGLSAVVALQPAYQGVGTPTMKSPVPMLTVAGACDEQVGPDEPVQDAKAFARANPKAPVLTAVMSHATHIATVAGGGSHEVGLVSPVEGKDCAADALAAPEVVQGATALVVADFLEQAHQGRTDFRLASVEKTSLSVAALNEAGTVSTHSVDDLPPAVSPDSITFDESTEALLPPLPEGMTIAVGKRGFDV